MDIATLVFVMACGPHCKPVGWTEHVGASTMAECLRVNEGHTRQRVFHWPDEKMSGYLLCIPALPYIVRFGRKGHINNWWEREATRAE